MALTPAQFTTLKNAIIADAAAGPMRTAGDSFSLLAWCNGPSATKAWGVAVSGALIYDSHVINEYISRSVPERQAFDSMCNPGRIHDFTVQSKRDGVANIFSGTTQNTSRTSIFAAAQVFATNAQLALGGSNASVGAITGMNEVVTSLVRNFTGAVSQEEVNRLLN